MATKREVLTELIKRKAANKDILGWGKLLFPAKFHLPYCKGLHQYLVATRDEEFSNTEAPRNHAKTAIQCFLIPLFQALEEPEKYQHYLNVQETSTKAASINLSIRSEIETNEVLREIYGDLVNPVKWTERQFVIKIKRPEKTYDIAFTAIGEGESMRGINYRNMRPDYINIDDLYSDDDIFNAESTKKKNNWFWQSLYLARSKSKKNSIHFQGTAINKYDLLNVNKDKPGIKSKTFRAIIDFDLKLVLWPELNSFDELIQDKERMIEDGQSSSVIFAREMQNERLDEASKIIKGSWFQEYKELPELEYRFIVADTAQKIEEKNDFSVFACFGVAKGRLYLIDLIRGKWEAPELKKTALMFWVKHNFHAAQTGVLRKFYVEDKSSGTGLIQEIRTEGSIPIEAIQRNTDKYSRCLDVQGKLEAGYVYLPKHLPFTSKFVQECEEFSAMNKTGHDDQVDVLMDAIEKGIPSAKRDWDAIAKGMNG